MAKRLSYTRRDHASSPDIHCRMMHEKFHTPAPVPVNIYPGNNSLAAEIDTLSLYDHNTKHPCPTPSPTPVSSHFSHGTSTFLTTTQPLSPSPAVPVAVITSIATGNPPTSLPQSTVATQVSSLFGAASPLSAKIPRIYAATKIATRHKAVDPLEPSFNRAMAIRDRMSLFLEHASPLAVDVAKRAVAGAGIVDPAREIGLLVVVTSTGFIAPGVDVAVLRGLGLSSSVGRVVISFMGCAAAMNGIRTGADYAIAHAQDEIGGQRKGKKALVVCVELSSVNGVFKQTMNDVIISSLFGDGCAAVVVGAADASAVQNGDLAPGSIVLRGSFSQLVDGTDDGIILGVNHDGITCDLSPKLPGYIKLAVGPAIELVLEGYGLRKKDIGLWAIHPGGPKIIEESLASLGLSDEVASVSWEMLSRFGNMLSVSLPFVLQKMAGDVVKNGGKTGVAFSFGPGITVEGVVFDVVA